MFGLGPTELIVILVLALLVLGPQRIPEAASSLGKAIRSFRRATRELRDQIDIDDDVRRPFEDLRSALRDEPAPLPPPSTSASGGLPGEAAAAAAGGASSLVQPPAEPVFSQTGDSDVGEGSAAPAGSPAAPANPPAHDGHRPPRGEPPISEPTPIAAPAAVAGLAGSPASGPAGDTKSEPAR